MEFNVNSPWLFVIAGTVIAAVIAQSVFFLIKSLKRSKDIGMDQGKIKKIIKTAAIYTIAPAVAIIISVIALSKQLGLAIPWLRLSVVGSLSYELVAAKNALAGMGIESTEIALNAKQLATVFAVMTVSIMAGIILVPMICEKYQKGMVNLEKKDSKWSNILQNALFIGMISAFVGFVFCDVIYAFGSYGGQEQSFAGLIPVCVFVISGLTMIGCGLCLKKFGWKWLNDYALPISLVIGMASAIPLTMWLK